MTVDQAFAELHLVGYRLSSSDGSTFYVEREDGKIVALVVPRISGEAHLMGSQVSAEAIETAVEYVYNNPDRMPPYDW